MVKVYYAFIHKNGHNIRYILQGYNRANLCEVGSFTEAFISTDKEEVREIAQQWHDHHLTDDEDRVCIGCLNTEVDPFFTIEVID